MPDAGIEPAAAMQLPARVRIDDGPCQCCRVSACAKDAEVALLSCQKHAVAMLYHILGSLEDSEIISSLRSLPRAAASACFKLVLAMELQRCLRC